MNIRTGKIARLPKATRDQLNLRLADGEPGPDLLAWLNELEPVQEVLASHFEGRPINGQNLTEWKQGGFLDWQRGEEARALAASLLGEARVLTTEAGAVPLADQLAPVAALALAQLLRLAMAAETPDRRAVVELVRELARLRRGDHEQARRAFARERWETARKDVEDAAQDADLVAETKEMDEKVRQAKEDADYLIWRYQHGMRTGSLSARELANLEALFVACPKEYGDRWRVEEPARPARSAQGKSNQIKPNQSKSNHRPALPAPAAAGATADVAANAANAGDPAVSAPQDADPQPPA